MINRNMRMIVMFDLPVTTHELRKRYTKFRKFLIKDGYSMVQFSVYSRILRNHDDVYKHAARLNKNLPKEGSVRLLTVTEKQYNAMKILVGEKTATEDFLTPEDILEC